jgi:biopolymer transport protein ExbB/TolQ
MKSTFFLKNDVTSQVFLAHFTSKVILILLIFLLVSVATTSAQLNENPSGQVLRTSSPQQSSSAPGLSVTKISDIKTFWTLTKLGGGISIAIFGVLALGLFLIIVQIYDLFQDKMKGRIILSTDYRQLSFNDVKTLVMKYPNNLTARLYSILLTIFQTTGNTKDFHDEVANYIRLQQDRFTTFKGRLGFLSDTAGALGLLGTVWGMFVTFFGGNLDSQRILNGMGLALVTTLIGLVVSVILNFFSTEVFSIFNKRLELISSKADEFRLRLMFIATQRQNKKGNQTNSGNGPTSSPRVEEVKTLAKPKEANPALLSLKPISELQQDGFIGENLPKPISILVETEKGQKVSGAPIVFRIKEGGGLLQNSKNMAWVKTDARGVAKIIWTLGPQVGPQRLTASLPDKNNEHLEFVSFAQPQLPMDLDFIASNDSHNNDMVN